MQKNEFPSELLVYQASNWAIELKADIDEETIWANQSDIAQIFWIDRTVISRHINNIFKDEELQKEVVSAKFTHTTQHGAMPGKTQKRNVTYYNLDIILAIWYRVKSSLAVKFRQRATQTLRKHITKWYTINPNRIKHNYEAFLNAVEEVKQIDDKKTLWNEQIMELIKMFAHTWFSLDAYDKDSSSFQWQTQESIAIQAEELYKDIAVLKKELIEKWEATEMFAQEKQKNNLAGILWNVFQTVWWEDVYPSVESKGAHLLYFIIKNHPFTDGNKRTGAFTLIRFLQKANFSFHHTLTPQALTALTLLVATSDPKDKQRIIELLILLLQWE